MPVPAVVCRAGRDAVEPNDIVCAEDCIRHEADRAVFCEDVHGIVDFDPVFDFPEYVSVSALSVGMKEGIPLVAKLHTMPLTMPRTTASRDHP